MCNWSDGLEMCVVCMMRTPLNNEIFNPKEFVLQLNFEMNKIKIDILSIAMS